MAIWLNWTCIRQSSFCGWIDSSDSSPLLSFLPICDISDFFHAVWRVQFNVCLFFKIWFGLLSYVDLNQLCMRCLCCRNAHPQTSDLYVIKSLIFALHERGRTLGDSDYWQSWICSVLSKNVVFIFDLSLPVIALETWSIKQTFVVIVII